MKLIDLLNKCSNGEKMPKIIKFENERYMWNGGSYFSIDGTRLDNEGDDYSPSISEKFNLFYKGNLNKEVEIIEEIEKPNIPQKISFKTTETQKEKNRLIKDTVNQIIDYLEKSEEK